MKKSSAIKRGLACGAVFIPLLGCAMNFQEVSERAYDVSANMIYTTGKVQASDYERASAMAAEPLSLEGSARRIRADDPIGTGTEYGMMVGFAVKTPGVKSAMNRQYDVLSKMYQAELQQQKGLIQVALKRDWLLYVLSEERVNILVDKMKLSETVYAMALKKHAAGRMSQMELLRFDTERQNAIQEHALAMMEAEHMQLGLKEATMLKEAVVVDDMPFEFIGDDGQVESRIDNAPAVGILRVREEELDAEIALLRHSRVDKVSMGVGMTQEPTQKSLDLKMVIPLVWNDKNEKKIAARMSERTAVVTQRDAALAKLRVRTMGSLEHLQEWEKRIKELVRAEKNYETLFGMAKKGFEGGVVPQFEYIAAQNTFYNARLHAVDLKTNYVTEMSAMEEKLGRIW